MHIFNGKIKVFALIFIWLMSSGSSCPPASTSIPTPTSISPSLQFSSKTPYWLQQDPSTYMQPPEGYVPVFINHLGRHGSRLYTSQKKLKNAKVFVGKTFAKQHDVPNWFAPYSEKSESLVGKITPLGVTQLEQIGKRMVQNFPELFENVKLNKDKHPIHAVATTRERAQESGDAFLKGLVSQLYGDVYAPAVSATFGVVREFPQVNEETCDLHHRFFDFCPKYREDFLVKAKAKFKNIKNKMMVLPDMQGTIDRIVLSLFSEDQAKNLKEKKKIAGNIYALCSFASNLDPNESQSTFCSLLQPDDIARYAHLADIKHYYTKGPAFDMGQSSEFPISVTQACKLMSEWLNQVDLAIEGKSNIQVSLRFAHAETVIPFATLLGLASGNMENDPVPFDADRQWNVARIAPMAANVQMILYKKEGADHLVKLMLNEREMPMPADMPDCGGKIYCPWSTVKAFYEKRGCDDAVYNERCCIDKVCDPCVAIKSKKQKAN